MKKNKKIRREFLSVLTREKATIEIREFSVKFLDMIIFEKVEIKWINSYNLEIRYILINNKEKNHLVKISIKKNGLSSKIIIENENDLTIRYFLMVFPKIL